MKLSEADCTPVLKAAGTTMAASVAVKDIVE